MSSRGLISVRLRETFLHYHYNEYCTLELAAARLGCYEDDATLRKKDDFSFGAKDFHKFIPNSSGKHDEALDYLRNDVRLTMAIANKIIR